MAQGAGQSPSVACPTVRVSAQSPPEPREWQLWGNTVPCPGWGLQTGQGCCVWGYEYKRTCTQMLTGVLVLGYLGNLKSHTLTLIPIQWHPEEKSKWFSSMACETSLVSLRLAERVIMQMRWKSQTQTISKQKPLSSLMCWTHVLNEISLSPFSGVHSCLSKLSWHLSGTTEMPG